MRTKAALKPPTEITDFEPDELRAANRYGIGRRHLSTFTVLRRWLLTVVEPNFGAGFHVDTPASEYERPPHATFEAERLSYIESCKAIGIDPYQLAIDTLPSFAAVRSPQD